MINTIKSIIDALLHPVLLLKSLGDYIGLARWRPLEPISDRNSLKEFLNTRASFVAQTSLYGYLRTRAGMRYPELFDDPPFVISINIAKWQIWLACLSDLSIYAGGLIQDNPHNNKEKTSVLIQTIVDEILEETSAPADAGDKFIENSEHLRKRIAICDWDTITDDEGPFTHSPQALVDWAPVVDEFKQLDQEIIINSVRFRWQKVRQDLRKALDFERMH